MSQTKPTHKPALHYAGEQWQARQDFVAAINEGCASEDILVEWLSDSWTAILTRGETVRYLNGYTFPLNNSSSSSVCLDKVATYEVLSRRDIPAIPHWLLYFGSDPTSPAQFNSLVQDASSLTPLPMVIKPLSGGMGHDVFKIITIKELSEKLRHISKHHAAAAASPFEEFEYEFRVVILDSKPEIIFRKTRPRDAQGNLTEWRHNLGLGALPSTVNDDQLEQELIELARQATNTLELRYAAVDIAHTATGLKIIEMNAHFSMDHLAVHAAFKSQIYTCYLHAIHASFDRDNLE